MPRTPAKPRARRASVEEKPTMGRPPMAPEERRTKQFHVLVTEAEYDELQAFAKATGLPTGTWARQLLLAATRKE